MPLHDHRRGLHAAMAGTDDPYAILTVERLALCRGLHGGERIAEPHPELEPLVAASLLTVHNGTYRPNFFIADREETALIDQHARGIGAQLAERLLVRWLTIAAAYATLAISRERSLAEMAFLLIGDRVLDVGLLDALAADGALMPPAPARPDPANPEARYYFWLIAGAAAHLGRYGQRAIPLPWPGWSLITFGQYHLGASSNAARDELEAGARQSLLAGEAQTPAALARSFALPSLGPEDTGRWMAVERDCTADLLAVYHEAATDLRALHAGLRAGAGAPSSFGEFFCWYDHVAYAHAIDALIAAGVLSIPAARFAAMLWHDAGGGAF